MPAPVVAVLNLKGGVGKTTLAAHVFREVFSTKRISILLIDLDPQFNLSQQLLAESRYNTLQAENKTTLRLFEPAPTSDFFDVNMSAQEPPEPNVLANRLRSLVLDPNKIISLIAGTFELTKFSFIEDHAKLTHARNFFKRSISKARAMYDLVVLDLNPSSSFLTFCGLSVATDVLSPVRPDKFSVLGLNLVKRLIDHQLVNPKPRLHIVMNSVKRSEGITVPEREIRTADYFKDCILVNRVYQSGVLVARPDYTGFASERKVSNRRLISAELRAVGLELCERLGI
jgi:chromosome partitioning protein